MYHISPVENIVRLEPRVPYLGGCSVPTEPSVPRVCAASTVVECLSAYGDLEDGMTYYIYQIDEEPHVSNHEVMSWAGYGEVEDAESTGEVWYLTPVECECVEEFVAGY